MNAKDLLGLVHPALAVILVFPILGMVVNMAWQTRQRRLTIAAGGKSLIPPIVNREHVKFGHYLTGAVVGLTSTALAYSIIFKGELFQQEISSIVFILLMFVATIGSLICLYQSRTYVWRGILAAMTSAGLIILGSQEGVFWRTEQWYISHYYAGILVSLLTIVALTIEPKIYEDRSNQWRKIHVILNCLALFLFCFQGMTGVRDLLDKPLSWQSPYLEQCDWNRQFCPQFKSSEAR